MIRGFFFQETKNCNFRINNYIISLSKSFSVSGRESTCNSNKYYCNTNFDIDYCINNFETIKNYYTKPDLIKERQKDLIETCPFFDKTLMNLLLK